MIASQCHFEIKPLYITSLKSLALGVTAIANDISRVAV